jgi:hypothetical protein
MYHFGGAPYGIRCKNRRALLGQFHDDDAFGLRWLIGRRLGQQLAEPREQKAERRKDNAICLLEH